MICLYISVIHRDVNGTQYGLVNLCEKNEQKNCSDYLDNEQERSRFQKCEY